MEYEISCSTPKLCLHKLPSKPRGNHHHHRDMLTPPLNTLASIPFEWEVAPGKPKEAGAAAAATITTTNVVITTPPSRNYNKNKTAAARCLDYEVITSSRSCSPNTVLDGPYYEARTFSFRKGWSSSSSSSSSSVINRKRRSLSNGSSWRLGSFKEERIKYILNDGGVDFSLLSDFDGFKNLKTPNVKITRIKRRSSLLNFFASNSNPLASIYESIKMAVPWRRLVTTSTKH